jgi:predicted O-methyltransferase YrrM
LTLVNNILRLVRALLVLVRSSLRGGSRHRAVPRRLAADTLDMAFEASSPLPEVQPHDLAVALDEFISLPPIQRLGLGNQSHSGLISLVTIARGVGATRVFEIGTYNGLTALTLALNLPDATIETLDLPSGVKPQLQAQSHDTVIYGDDEERLYRSSPVADRIVQHLGDSATFDFSHLRASFDLVYVDGAHSRAYVENDTRVAYELVKADGVIVWDDYWRRMPDVSAVLHSLPEPIHRIAGTRLAAWFSPAALASLLQR